MSAHEATEDAVLEKQAWNELATRDLYVMVNSSTSPVQFSIHAQTDKTWMGVVDTSLPSPMDLLSRDTEIPLTQRQYRVNQRSIVVLAQSRGNS